MQTFGVFCKHPSQEVVKPRLVDHLGTQGAVNLSAAFLDDLTFEFRQVGERRVLGFAPANASHYFQPFTRFGYDLWPQPEGDRGQRSIAFFSETLRNEGDSAVLMACNSPTIPTEYVRLAFEQLNEFDCVVGPATDGGYYLIGLRKMVPEVFQNIIWSASSVLSQTVQRIASRGLTLAVLPPWYDVEDVDDLWMLAGHIRAMTRSGQTHPCPSTALVLQSLRMA